MIDHSLIRRYIAAVYELAAKSGEIDRVREELARLQQTASADPRLLAILRHPDITADEKRGILLRLAGETPSQITQGLVYVLLEKERLEVLLGAADVFTQMVDDARGVVRARVEVAMEPTQEQKQRLQAALSHLLGAPVVAEYSIEPDVIGGARLKVAGRLIDGSLSGRLASLVEQTRSA